MFNFGEYAGSPNSRYEERVSSNLLTIKVTRDLSAGRVGVAL